MKAEQQHQEPQSRTIQTSKDSNGLLSFVDNRPESVAQAKMIAVIQRMGMEDEEELQMKPVTQLQSDDEELQMKPVAQLQSEDEELQMKPIVQLQSEDEEPLQGKFETIQQYFPVQRTVESKPDVDATITAELNTIDTNAGNAQTSTLGDICDNKDLETAITTAVTSADNQGCAGVSKDASGVIRVEASIYNKMPSETGRVTKINNRPDGVHSEVHHYNNNGCASIWTTQHNCFFCSGFLHEKGIGHQDMKTSNIFPQRWTSDGDRWKIIKKRKENNDWCISHSGETGYYKKVF